MAKVNTKNGKAVARVEWERWGYHSDGAPYVHVYVRTLRSDGVLLEKRKSLLDYGHGQIEWHDWGHKRIGKVKAEFRTAQAFVAYHAGRGKHSYYL